MMIQIESKTKRQWLSFAFILVHKKTQSQEHVQAKVQCEQIGGITNSNNAKDSITNIRYCTRLKIITASN